MILFGKNQLIFLKFYYRVGSDNHVTESPESSTESLNGHTSNGNGKLPDGNHVQQNGVHKLHDEEKDPEVPSSNFCEYYCNCSRLYQDV
jgi:hypothetical protein